MMELDFEDDPEYNLTTNAYNIVAHTNMAMVTEDKRFLLESADKIEKTSNTGYYDDNEGADLLKAIAAYYRAKANQI